MARERKYAGLPDMDDAPDIYETPDLTDDISTVPTTTGPSHSDDEFYDVEDDTQAISRSRLRIDEARSRFLPAGVGANGVDFSDRVDGKRKSYKASNRRQRVLQDGTHEFGDLSDEEDDESLERRIARLKREVEEAKDEYARRMAASATTNDDEEESDSNLESLSKVLDQISKPKGAVQASAPFKPLLSGGKSTAETTMGPDATYSITYAPEYEQSHALAKAADFDLRLAMLEKGLGITSGAVAETDSNGLPRALIPTLDSLEKQISTLAQASTANLDAISRRVRTLASEQEKLNESREKAKTLQEELGKHAPTSPVGEESEQDAKIKALYAILPTIENLTPILPPLLDRLRSLRAIHAESATASETLMRIEREQSEMTAELKQWRVGLEKMESTMKEGDATVKGNMDVMGGWVKDLEERMAKLS